jgi:hypothetical protein
MTAGSDSGSSSTDNNTSDNTPSFDVSCVDGTSVQLFDGNTTPTGPSGSCSGGTVTLTADTLSDGNHMMKAKQTDPAGNTSSLSSGLSVDIDTSVPAATGTPDMTAGTDTGLSNSDDTTSDNTPTFTVSCANGNTVQLYSDAVATGSNGACSGGTVTLTAATLSDGNQTITATQSTTAGGTSAASSGLPVTIDTAGPILSSSVPADNASGVSKTASFVLNFNESVLIDTGSLVLKKSSDDSTVQSIAMSGGLVTGVGSSTLTVSHDALNDATGYYITIDATALLDTAGNSYPGISTTTDLNFTTSAAPASSSSSSSAAAEHQSPGGSRGHRSVPAPSFHPGPSAPTPPPGLTPPVMLQRICQRIANANLSPTTLKHLNARLLKRFGMTCSQ